MTTKAFEDRYVPATCHNCGASVKAIAIEDPLYAWIRACPELDSRDFGLTRIDIDAIGYRSIGAMLYHMEGQVCAPPIHKTMILEGKGGMREPDHAHVTMYTLLHQALLSHQGKDVSGYGGLGPFRYYGAHLIQYDGKDPGQSGQITIDQEHTFSLDRLIRFLRFDFVRDDPAAVCQSSKRWLGLP